MNAACHLLSAFLVLAGARLMAFETVVIDPGHGGADEGTAWYKLREKDLTLSVAKHLENILIDRGIHTVMTRRWDHYVTLDDRARTANRIPNSLLLSIHFNASREHNIAGFETFFFFASPSSRCLADSIQTTLDRETPGHARAVKPQDYAVLARTHGLAVLVECGFLSNKAESARLATNDGQEALAKALADGLMRVKPLMDVDPPTTDFARWAINSRKLDQQEHKHMLAATADPPSKAKAPSHSKNLSSNTPKKKTPVKKKKKTNDT
jgi:N-acetylmuramoyl-L-alanine amidase